MEVRSGEPRVFGQSSSLQMVLEVCNRKGASWNDVIRAKYEEEGGWFFCKVREGLG